MADLENLLNNTNSDDEDGENITAQKVLENLQNAWLNEKFAPDILPHQTEIVDLMLEQITHMEQNMIALAKNDFRSIAHQMEIERIRYIISSYIRTRLKKIELFTKHILIEDDIRSEDNKLLNEAENKYAREYLENCEQYFHQIALQYIPGIQRTEAEQRIIRPNLMSHVFLKANHSVAAVVVGADDEEVDLAVGSQHIVPYQLISDLVQKGSAQLI